MADWGNYDFSIRLNMNDRRLYVDKRVYPNGELVLSGPLAFSDELLNLRGTSVDEMCQILLTYNIDRSDIFIIPWQNPISSYIGEYWIITDGEDREQKREDYVEAIEDMLFREQVQQPNDDSSNVLCTA